MVRETLSDLAELQDSALHRARYRAGEWASQDRQVLLGLYYKYLWRSATEEDRELANAQFLANHPPQTMQAEVDPFRDYWEGLQ